MLQLILMSIAVTVSNPLNEVRENVPIVLEVPADAVDAKSVVIKGGDGVQWQLDDLNEDGKVDQLVLMLPTLGAKAKETLKIEFSQSEVENAAERSTAAMMRLSDKNQKHPELHAISFPGTADNKQIYNSIYGHGALLEGLWSAIRVYMDNRQSVDLYLKQTPRMELDTTFFYTTSKQLDDGFGRDVLWAGTSVALGSFRGLNAAEEPQTIDQVLTRGQRVVVSGPIRSIIEVVDRGWITPQGEQVDMVQRYTMFANSRDYEVEIRLTPATSGKYCTGIQKLAQDPEGFSETVSGGELSGSWGTNLPDKGMPDNYETLGLGIFVPEANSSGQKEDELNYLTILHPDTQGVMRYTFTATGLLDSTTPANDFSQWQQWLRNWARQKAAPVDVEIK